MTLIFIKKFKYTESRSLTFTYWSVHAHKFMHMLSYVYITRQQLVSVYDENKQRPKKCFVQLTCSSLSPQ